MRLRDGYDPLDPRMDVLFDKDPRNRQYPAMAAAPDTWDKVDKAWPRTPVTDQGAEGACVGHGCTGFLLALGLVPDMNVTQAEAFALEHYQAAQRLDEWPETTGLPGSPGGTSIKAGMDVARERGYIEAFLWAFGVEEALKALTTVSPLVIAVEWRSDMYEATGGKVRATGSTVGRHCLKVDEVRWSTDEVVWQNSWGVDYGDQGRASMSFDDFDALLQREGEVAVAVPRLPQVLAP